MRGRVHTAFAVCLLFPSWSWAHVCGPPELTLHAGGESVTWTINADLEETHTRYTPLILPNPLVALVSRKSPFEARDGVFTIEPVGPGITTLSVEWFYEPMDMSGTCTVVINVEPDAAAGGGQVPADCNQDGAFDISDPICLLGFLFTGSPSELPCGDGLASHGSNLRLIDWNGDGSADISDPVRMLIYLFTGGPPHSLGMACLPIAGCPSVCPGPPSGLAELFRSRLALRPGETWKAFWTTLTGPGEVLIQAAEGLQTVASTQDGEVVAVAEGPDLERPDVLALRLGAPDEYVIVVSRPREQADSALSLEVGILFDDPASIFHEDTQLEDHILHSPLRVFPSGEEVFDVPPGASQRDFLQYVSEEFGYSPEAGIPFLVWLAFEELPLGGCAPGPLPPAGASHDENYCSISTFIHSMESKFPGALKPDVRTNPTSWDEVGDKIGHCDTFGARGRLLRDKVNTNYGGVMPMTQNNVLYCSIRLSDASPANLAAWLEDCDLKLLVYDFSNLFGHWVDVTAVSNDPFNPTMADITVQDYELSYRVGFTESFAGSDLLDFSRAPATSVMGKNFKGANTVAGDDFYEPLGFSVVCPCDSSTADRMPSMTRSGKTLRR